MKRTLDGQWTKNIYTLIAEKRYQETIQHLQSQLEFFPNNRATLSLLAYCFYNLQDYNAAAACYEKLSRTHPEVVEYKIYYSQSLYKSGNYVEAAKAIIAVNDPAEFTQRMLKLSAYRSYEQGDYVACKGFLERCQTDPDVIIAHGCLLFQDKKYEEARVKFSEALNTVGYKNSIAYNIALCYYQMKQFMQARKHIIDIIKRGFIDHPELGIGTNQDGVEAKSVGNTLTLRETALIETFNLKAAIEFELKNYVSAKESLADMPPRTESELDPITLHNVALMNMDDNPNEHLPKLNFLLSGTLHPPTTFANILLLYCKFEHYDVAADIMAENEHFVNSLLSQDLHSFLEAFVLQKNSPEESFRKFDELANKHVENLRRLTKAVTESRNANDESEMKINLKNYDDAIEKYIPVLTGQARIYWNMENYQLVEKVLSSGVETAVEHEIWKLNIAHTLFMQSRFSEAIKYYEFVVSRYSENLLFVKAVVLANLCVSYILTNYKGEAEDLMRKIEKEEENLLIKEPKKKVYHLCIVKLVIGTLYCSKQMFEFGITMVMKSLEPFEKRLDTDTWFYAKRCFLAFADNLTKHIVTISDGLYKDILLFFGQCEKFGKGIPSTITNFSPEELEEIDHPTINQEARQLKALFIKLRGW